MFEFVWYRHRYAIVIIVLISLIVENTYCRSVANTKKDGVDVFDLLLGLYKINPLKSSKVYTKFASNVLTQGDKKNYNVNFSSNENRSIQKVTFQQLKDIEKVLHPVYRKQSRHSVEKPEFDVEDVDIENFNVDVIVRDKSKSEKYGTTNILDRTEISSNENNLPHYAPNAKELPGSQWLLPNTIKHNPAPKGQWFSEFQEHRYAERYYQVPRSFPGPPIISDNKFQEHRYAERYNQVPRSLPGPPIISDNELIPGVAVL